MDAVKSIVVGESQVNFTALTIEGPEGRVSIEPKVMDLLQMLVESAGTVVSRTDLIQRVWNEHPGGDESLSRAISLLRKAFDEVHSGQQYITTVPKRGYRLIAGVAPADPGSSDTTSHPTGPRITATHRPRRHTGRSGLAIMGLGAAMLVTVLVLFLAGDTSAPVSKKAESENDPGDTLPIATITRKSLAVLPLEDLSGEGNQQYLADGLAEEILNALVKFPDLRVTGRQSSFSFRGDTPDLEKISSTLAVSHVLTGSVRKQGSRVRITVRLVQTADGITVWSERYDGDLRDIFDLQEHIARQTASKLGVILDLTGQQRIAPQLTQNREAYELFLHGRTLARKFGHHNKQKAGKLLERAIELDPNFAAAWAWLGQAHIYQTLSEPEHIPAHLSAARMAVQRALNLDPDLAIAHYVQSILYAFDLDLASAVDAVEKAWQLNPNQPMFAIRRGYYRAVIGQSSEGAQLMEQGLRWDPTDAIGLVNLGIARQATGNLDAAVSFMHRAYDLGFQPAAGQLCIIMSLRHEDQAAASCWNELSAGVKTRYQRVFNESYYWPILAGALFLDDETARQKVLARMDQYLEDPGAYLNPYLQRLYPTLEEQAQFMRSYVEHRFPLNAGVIAGIWDEDPHHRAVRQHPGFPAFAERIGLVKAWQKYGWPDRCQKVAATQGSDLRFSCD